MKYRATQSLAMLNPEPVALTLAGRDCVALELRVADVGAIEKDFARLMPHPFHFMRSFVDRVFAMPKDTPEAHTVYIRTLMNTLGRAMNDGAYPPMMGNAAFGDVMATEEGASAYLWHALRRTNAITRDESDEIAWSMTRGEWNVLGAVVWGPGEAGQDGSPSGSMTPAEEFVRRRSGSGVDWAGGFRRLAKEFGWTPAQINELYLSQFFAALWAGADAVTLELPDRPERYADERYQLHIPEGLFEQLAGAVTPPEPVLVADPGAESC